MSNSMQLTSSEYVPTSGMLEQCQCSVSADFSSSCIRPLYFVLSFHRNRFGKFLVLPLKIISSHLLSLKNYFFNMLKNIRLKWKLGYEGKRGKLA